LRAAVQLVVIAHLSSQDDMWPDDSVFL